MYNKYIFIKICMGMCVFINRKIIRKYLTLVFNHGWGGEHIITDSCFYILCVTIFYVFIIMESIALHSEKNIASLKNI